jgi:hypothetical protein
VPGANVTNQRLALFNIAVVIFSFHCSTMTAKVNDLSIGFGRLRALSDRRRSHSSVMVMRYMARR